MVALPSPPSSSTLPARVAVALRRAGATVPEVEEAAATVAHALGEAVQVHVFPSVVFEARPDGVKLWPAEPSGSQLARLASVLAGVEALAAGEGPEAVERALAAPEKRRPLAVALAGHVGTAAAAAVLFGGGPVEAAVAGGIGVAAALLTRPGSTPGTARVREGLAALVAAVLAHAAAAAVPGTSAMIPLLGGLVTLLPGYALTVGVTELAAGHLVSGSARMVSGALTLLELGVGVGAGTHLALRWFGATAAGQPGGAADAVVLACLPPLALTYTVLLGARMRQAGWVLVGCLVAWAGARAGAAAFGAPIGAGLGALAVTLAGRGLHRLPGPARAASPLLVQVPGLLLLVPGATGFAALHAMLADDVLTAARTGFDAMVTAAALATGSLAGAALLRPPRAVALATGTAPLGTQDLAALYPSRA